MQVRYLALPVPSPMLTPMPKSVDCRPCPRPRVSPGPRPESRPCQLPPGLVQATTGRGNRRTSPGRPHRLPSASQRTCHRHQHGCRCGRGHCHHRHSCPPHRWVWQKCETCASPRCQRLQARTCGEQPSPQALRHASPQESQRHAAWTPPRYQAPLEMTPAPWSCPPCGSGCGTRRAPSLRSSQS